MRVFEEPNLSNGWKCPICNQGTAGQVILAGKAGTEDDGIAEAEQFHLECIELVYHEREKVLLSHWENKA